MVKKVGVFDSLIEDVEPQLVGEERTHRSLTVLAERQWRAERDGGKEQKRRVHSSYMGVGTSSPTRVSGFRTMHTRGARAVRPCDPPSCGTRRQRHE